MYTVQQQVFALAMVASADYTEPRGSPPPLEADLSTALANLCANDPDMPTWTMAWGPVVYESSILGVDSGVEDNAVFVAQGSDADGKTLYVVSIAGTNPLSIVTDIQQEDLETTLSAWAYGVPAALDLSPNVTQGTLEGLGNLMGMQDPTTGDSLATFLQGAKSTSARVIITGHSLGGALAPALALALFGDPGNTSTGGGGLDPADWKAVHVYPIAGPAVGDQDYATFYAKTFPPTTNKHEETWNLLVWNSLDVVPHAWNQMSQVPTLYPDLATSKCLTSVLSSLGALGGSGYVQLQNQQLSGTFAAPSNKLKPVSAFVAEVVYQHVSAYFDLLNVPGVSTALNVPNPLGSPPSAALFGVCEFFTKNYCPLLEQFDQCGPL